MSENVDVDNNAETSTIDSCTDAFQDAVSSSVEEVTTESESKQKSTQATKDHMCCTSGVGSETSSVRKHLHQHQHMSQLQAWLDAREAELEKREAAVRAAQSDYRKQTQSLRLELERKEAELTSMQQKITSLVKAKVDLQEELEMTKVSARFKQSEMQQEINRIQRELLDSVGEKKDSGVAGGYAREISELKEYVQQLKSQNQSLMVELDAFSEQEKERYSMQPNSQQSFHQEETTSEYLKVRELEDELTSERETSVELREQLMAVRQELNSKIDNLEMQLQLERMKSAQAEAQLVDAGSSSETPVFPVSTTNQNPIQHMAVKYAEELQEAEMRAVDAERRLDQLSQALTQKEDEMGEAQKNLVTLRKNLLSMNNQVVGLTSQVGELQNRLRAKAGQLEIAQFQVDRYRQQVDRSRQTAQSHQLSAFLFLAYLGPRIVNIGKNLHFINQQLMSNQRV